jgi:hypothetical protein
MNALGAVCAVVLMALTLDAPVAAAAVPRVGSFDASSGPTALSFQVARSGRGLVIEDLVLTPPRCLGSSGLYQYSSYGPVSGDGRLGPQDGFITGRFTSSTNVVVRVVGKFSRPRCRVNETLDARLSRRIAVRDGHWQGQSSLGDPVSLTVSLGGRVATIGNAQTTLTVCGQAPENPNASGGPLFITATGALDFTQLDYHVQFTGPTTAGGHYTISGACAHDVPISLTWTGA